jgi:hypothetical protein
MGQARRAWPGIGQTGEPLRDLTASLRDRIPLFDGEKQQKAADSSPSQAKYGLPSG